jgi:hypothetical protein
MVVSNNGNAGSGQMPRNGGANAAPGAGDDRGSELGRHG